MKTETGGTVPQRELSANAEVQAPGEEGREVRGERTVVLGRREFGVILLAVMALLFYLVLLSTVPSSAQTGGDTIDGDQSITIDEDIDEEITEQENEDLQENVIAREPTVINIPRKPLPPTGGLPVYATVAGFILAGTGLLALGVGIRRGQRR